jgi:integrase
MHFKYREIIEHVSPNAIVNNLKAIKRYLNICGINPDDIRYKPPIIPENNDIHVPKPEIVHNLITHTYSKDPYQNNLIQYLLCHNFMLGWRVPSEPAIMKTTNIDLDNECILIVEPKKHNRKRTIYPEPYIINGRRYKSFKNWIEHWRPKVANQYSKDFLYLQPDGRPFTNDTLRIKLSRAVKPVWNGYYPYISRHWCAVARLLEWNLKVIRVRDFLGHVKIETTMGYLRTANQFYDRNEKDWLKRALRKHKTVFGDSSLPKKPATAFQEKANFSVRTLSSTGTSPVEMYGPGGIRTRDLQLRRLSPNPD